MKRILLAISSLFLAVSAQQGRISVNTTSRMMQDEAGRSVMFHGVNIVYKVWPYTIDIEEAEIDQMVQWGFNFVRMGVMWEAVERSPGVYNETYLDEVEALINKLGKKGIYTLVDGH